LSALSWCIGALRAGILPGSLAPLVWFFVALILGPVGWLLYLVPYGRRFAVSQLTPQAPLGVFLVEW